MMTEATSFMVCTGVQQYLLMAGHLLLLLTAPWTIYVSLDFCAHVFKLKTNYLPHSLALKACLCYSEMHEKRALRQASNTMGPTNLSIRIGIILLKSIHCKRRALNFYPAKM